MIDDIHSYDMNHSIIGIILKNKDKIREHVRFAAPMKSTIISKIHGKMREEIEKLLSVWMQVQHQCLVPLSLMII